MTVTSLRCFLGTCFAAPATGLFAQTAKLSVLGKVAPRDSLAIDASPLSLGFETLDRKLFDPERAYPHLAKLGVKWARVHTGWCLTELTRGEYGCDQSPVISWSSCRRGRAE